MNISFPDYQRQACVCRPLSKRRNASLAGACVIAVVFPMGALYGQERNIVSLDTVVANVRSNESLYVTLEAVTSTSYKLEPGAWRPPDAVESETIVQRSVMQDGKVYFKSARKGIVVDKGEQATDELLGYDGETTRAVVGGVANIHHGKYEPPALFRPHAWLIRGAQSRFPLSFYLQGGSELRNHPLAGIYRDLIHKVSVQSVEEVSGLKCIKIRIEDWNDDKPPRLNSTRFLWLAMERNYLPVKTTGYIAHLNNELPAEISTASDFREIAPGIWLPFQRTIVAYDQPTLVHERRAVVSNMERAIIETCSLDPHYGSELFQNIPIPNGTLVYEMHEGEILKSYIKGSFRDFMTRWRSRLAVGVVVLVNILLIGAWILVRRRRVQSSPVGREGAFAQRVDAGKELAT